MCPDADLILQRLRDAGFIVQAIGGDAQWFMFARRDGLEWSVRGNDAVRAARALVVSVGLDCNSADDAGDDDSSNDARQRA